MNAREVALYVVRDVFPTAGRARGAQEALDYRVRAAELSARDRAFATELAYGAIKMRRLLDWYLQPFLGERAATLAATAHEALRLAIYELRFTRADEHATVYEFVEIAKRRGHRGLAGLVNAVLRSYLREPPLEPARDLFDTEDEYVGTRYSLPTWLVRQWRGVFGTSLLEAICSGVNAPTQAAITVNRRRIQPAALADRLRNEGVETRPSQIVADCLLVERSPEPLHEARANAAWWMQSESSAVPVEVLGPQSGERIVDLCSGRGNKALQIASRLGDDGELVCVDRDERRTQVLQRRLAEYGLVASTIVSDVREVDFGRRFDRVLLDAPCSGTGVVGRHAEARWKKESTDGERLAAVQHALLEAASDVVHDGGALVYAVCSNDPRESTEVVERFLSQHRFARGLIPAAMEPFLTDAGDVSIPPGIEGRDGFYVARLERAL
ncbi:MAG TPA: transcription antitermination factor NusB [Candidatus Dormibacteraeota bacterium]|nr:transcription antitermination factor NusB [Candidatus Dormibacteraeota bacterium]